MVTFTVDRTPEELVGKYSSEFEAAGLTVSLTRSTAANGTTASLVGFSQESQNVAVVAPPVSFYGDGPFVTLTHTPSK